MQQNQNPKLSESQILKLASIAETLVKKLPLVEPKPHNAKKKNCRELEVIIFLMAKLSLSRVFFLKIPYSIFLNCLTLKKMK